MKENNILIFNFEAHKPPVFKEVKGKDYVLFGSDKEWKNRYPDYLVDLYNKSSKHNAIINGKTNYISGRGWVVDSSVNTLEDKVKLSNFILNVGNESLHELTKKIVKDNELFDGFSLEVIVNKDGKGLTINHIDFGNIRVGTEEDIYFFTSNWASKKPEKNEDYTTLSLFPWDDTAEKGKSYLIYYKSYRPNLQEYPLPSYLGGVPYIEADFEVANYVLNNTKNGYSGGTVWNFHNGEPTDEAKAYIERQIKEKRHGSDNAGAPTIIFDDGKDRGVEILSINPNGQDDKFINLNKQIQIEIFTAHKVDSSIFIKTEGSGFTNNADEKRTAIESLHNEYVEPRQRIYEELFNRFATYLGMKGALKIERIAPISQGLSESILNEVMTTAEIRAKAGLPVLEAADAGGAADALATLSPLVATKVLDNMTTEEIRGLVGLKGSPPLRIKDTKFSSEIINHAFATLGFTDKEIEVIEILDIDYNPFDFADVSSIDSQIIDIIKADPKVTVKEISLQVGETPSKVQDRINRLINNNLLEPTKNAKKVTPKGEAVVEELITVYKYAKRPDVSGGAIIAGTRDWCRNRLAEGRSYTREDLLSMVNTFGQSAFTHRGGWYNQNGVRVPFCRHIWSARTVKLKNKK